MQELVTSSVLARRWGISRQRVVQLVKAGRLDAAYKYSGVYLFLPSVERPAKLPLGRPKVIKAAPVKHK